MCPLAHALCGVVSAARLLFIQSVPLITLMLCKCKKSLKIPKGQSESLYRRRTDNTMANRKSTNNDQQNIHIKLKIEQHEPT